MQSTTYVRLFADDQGETHFEDVQVDLQPVDFSPPAPPLNVAALSEARAVALVGGEPSWQGSIPHPTPRRQLMCVMTGVLETTASDRETRVFGPGSLILLEDTEGKGHSTRLPETVVVIAIELE